MKTLEIGLVDLGGIFTGFFLIVIVIENIIIDKVAPGVKLFSFYVSHTSDFFWKPILNHSPIYLIKLITFI